MSSLDAASTAPVSAAPASRRTPEDLGVHVVPVGGYIVVYAALLVLTAATTAVAFVDLGPLNNVVAVGIAMVKATLVILVFMHVRWSPRLIPLAAAAGFFWLILLLFGALSDYLTRGLLGFPGK